MDWKRFLSAPSGRIAVGTSAWLVAAAGMLALSGPGTHVVTLLSVAVLLGVVGSIFAVGLAIEEHGAHALMMVIALPLLGGPYLGALHVASDLGKPAGVVLLLFAGAAAARALWGPRSLAASRPRPEGAAAMALEENVHARP